MTILGFGVWRCLCFFVGRAVGVDAAVCGSVAAAELQMFVNAAREVIDFHAQFLEASTDRRPPFHNVVPVPTISSTKGVALIKKDRAPRPGLINFNYY